MLVVGAVVRVGITNDRKERLDRRLDEAAGFATPFVARGVDEIPRSPDDRDAVITVRRGNLVTSNSVHRRVMLICGFAIAAASSAKRSSAT